MSSEKIIISTTSAEYFSFIVGMVLSIREKPEGESVAIGIYDLGLTDLQKEWLKEQDVIVVKPQWQFGLDDNSGLSIVYKGLLARPFISRYFPGFKKYLYIDADAWVQEWTAVDDYFRGIDNSVIAITPEINPAFSNHFSESTEYHDFVFEAYESCRGSEYAKKYRDYFLLNAGVFAIPEESPVWQLWEKELGISIQQTRHHCVEQTSLNIALLTHFDLRDHHSIQLLSAPHNWLCHLSLPFFDSVRSKFVEPYVPYSEIGIVHRSSDEFKTHKTVPIYLVDGGEKDCRVLYDEGSYLEKLPEELIVKKQSNWQQREGKKF